MTSGGHTLFAPKSEVPAAFNHNVSQGLYSLSTRPTPKRERHHDDDHDSGANRHVAFCVDTCPPEGNTEFVHDTRLLSENLKARAVFRGMIYVRPFLKGWQGAPHHIDAQIWRCGSKYAPVHISVCFLSHRDVTLVPKKGALSHHGIKDGCGSRWVIRYPNMKTLAERCPSSTG
jgi:hypothetical protein